MRTGARCAPRRSIWRAWRVRRAAPWPPRWPHLGGGSGGRGGDHLLHAAARELNLASPPEPARSPAVAQSPAVARENTRAPCVTASASVISVDSPPFVFCQASAAAREEK